MGLTDPDGNPIPADDPRLPSVEETAQAKAHAEALIVRVNQMGAGIALDVLDVRAKVESLVSLMVPPDETNPIRRLYLHRIEVFRGQIMEGIVAEIEEARKRATGLTVATPNQVPKFPDLLKKG